MAINKSRIVVCKSKESNNEKRKMLLSWKEYFYELLNGEEEGNGEFRGGKQKSEFVDSGNVEVATILEAERAVKKLKKTKSQAWMKYNRSSSYSWRMAVQQFL